MWLVYGLLSSASFAVINVIDSICVRDFFLRPWIGSFVGALATLIVIIGPLPILLPFIELDTPTMLVIGLALSAGVALHISNVLYFQALSYSEAGIVSAYWNLTPVIVIVSSYFLFAEQLTVIQYVGILILVTASILIYLTDASMHARTKAITCMVVASLCLSIMYLLEEYVFQQTSFFTGFYIINIGLVIAGLFPMLIPHFRKTIVQNAPKLLPYAKFFLAIELVNIIAIALSQKAIDIGLPGRVATLETTMPGFTFIIGALLVILVPTIADKRVTVSLYRKIGLVLVMGIGVWFIS